jgi:hypothetical protein
MLFMDIPFVVENKRIDKENTRKELAALELSQTIKDEALEAIYNLKPRGVLFDNKDLKQAQLLERVFSKLGIPYRLAEVSEFA